MNVANFIGVKTVGKSANVSMLWSISASGADFEHGTSPNPDLPYLSQQPAVQNSGEGWLKFEIDPVAQQGSFTFGTGVAMQLAITRLKSYVNEDDSYIGGRVLIYIPTSGQVFVFGPKQIVNSSLDNLPPTGAFFYEYENAVLPISLSQGCKVEVWMEVAVEASNAGPAGISDDLASVYLTLFNFPISPVAA